MKGNGYMIKAIIKTIIGILLMTVPISGLVYLLDSPFCWWHLLLPPMIGFGLVCIVVGFVLLIDGCCDFTSEAIR